MRAVVMRDFGPPEVLRVEQVPIPDAGPGDLLVRVAAVSVNRSLDLAVRAGDRDRDVVRLPHVLGTDPVGTIEWVGADVTGWQPGERVAVHSSVGCGECATCVATSEFGVCERRRRLGVRCWGGCAEYVVVAPHQAFRIPAQVSFHDATVIVRHIPTALRLAELAELKPGQVAVVMGAAGALGLSLVQVACALGATVIAGAGSGERVAAAVKLGAQYGVDYRAQDLTQFVLDHTGGAGADVIFDNMADPSLWGAGLRSLTRGGRLVAAGAHAGGLVELDVRRLYNRRLRVIGGAGAQRTDVFRALHLAVDGAATPVIRAVFPFEQAAQAHHLTSARDTIGKVLLDPTVV